MPGNSGGGGDYRAQIAALMAQMYGGQGAQTGPGGMYGAPMNAQNPMLAQMMQRGPSQMAKGPMALGKMR